MIHLFSICLFSICRIPLVQPEYNQTPICLRPAQSLYFPIITFMNSLKSRLPSLFLSALMCNLYQQPEIIRDVSTRSFSSYCPCILTEPTKNLQLLIELPDQLPTFILHAIVFCTTNLLIHCMCMLRRPVQ